MSRNQPPKNIKELRDVALQALTELRNREIDTTEALAVGKVCDTVLGTIKSEYEYARATGQEPNVPFMHVDNSNQLALEAKNPRKQLDIIR